MAQYTNNLRQQLAINGNEIRELHGLPPVPELNDDYNPHAKAQAEAQEVAHQHGIEMQEKQHQRESEEAKSDESVPEPEDRTKEED
jgi:hypothetical protein